MYVNVQLVHLGRGVNEVVVANEDGGHTVFIEAQLSDQGRKAAYRHAMQHIEEDDFGKHGTVGGIESEAHAALGGGAGEDAPEAAGGRGLPRKKRIKNPVRAHRECQ